MELLVGGEDPDSEDGQLLVRAEAASAAVRADRRNITIDQTQAACCVTTHPADGSAGLQCIQNMVAAQRKRHAHV